MDAANSQKFTEVIFTNMRDGIVTLDRDFRIVSANESIQRWAGRPAADLINRDSREVFHKVSQICPHCAALPAFETGEITTVTQKSGNQGTPIYAELSVYPVRNERGEVAECIVFIQDITDRMLCHDEVLRLYSEMTQTKEYLESIIEHSADGIVTSDLNGIITSWNKGAERIYGFTKKEALGQFLPFVPEFLMETEWENNRKMRNGEVLERIETFRKRKDGTIISVSLTLSPIKNAVGEIIGISGISRDISEKKNVEKELIRRNQELSRLFFISSAMRGTLDLDRVLRMVLTAVTMGDGLGFNRAILFLVDEEKNILRAAMGVGPASYEEAFHVWEKLSLEKKTLSDIMQEIAVGLTRKDSFFDRLSHSIEIPLTEDTSLTRAVKEQKAFNIDDVGKEPLSDAVLIQQLGTRAFAAVPLISRNKVIGVLWVDNYFNNRSITEEDMRFLTAFSNHVASAIENARLFERVKLAEQELENIFESISDMVYFVTEDYVVKNINQAVSKRLGKSPEEIIGKKCYEIFHGMHQPWAACPHQKTVERREAFVQEVEDSHMGGTFITSSSPIFDITGKFMGTVHVVSDITELKNLRERVIKTERMAALGEVAARVAHEIRNPLVSLGGFARRLEKKLNGSMKEYADIIAKEVGRLEDILNEILSFVKETRIQKECVAAQKLMEDVISLVRSEIDDRGIALVREFGDPIELYVDPNRVKDALLNIVKNAIQALENTGTISLRIYRKDKTCILEISDTGPGIAEEDLPFIFDPFYTTKKAGTGLGLTITHRIIEEHDGRIEVESKAGEGSIFRVVIPIKEP
ncbi:MAG: sensor histidine kinase [Nitrospirae bacterium]|nr:sensor histidine kinase [Nitrospirota bacterium]